MKRPLAVDPTTTRIGLRERTPATLPETLLFLFGAAAIALHVLDDSFLQPQPGTSARDHLLSGLVPTAVLVLAAWIYPRLRAGALAPRSLSCSASSGS